VLEPRKSLAVLLTASLQPRTCAAHHHPFSCALLEEIHINKLAAGIFSVTGPLFLDGAVGYGNIAVHLHVYWSILKPLKFVMEGFEIG
jgi:hypothetical protein